MNTRTLTAFLVALFFVVAAGLYRVAEDVRAARAALAATKEAIIEERAKIRVLAAQWASYDDPRRLEGLIRRFPAGDIGALAPLTGRQLARLDETPMRPPPPPTPVPAPRLAETETGAAAPDAPISRAGQTPMDWIAPYPKPTPAVVDRAGESGTRP